MLFVHPFAEEMNKSRRMVSLNSRALAAAGFDVLLIDLLGCGDSSGDFGDATWGTWERDLDAAIRWLAARGDGPVWLWGLRIGGLLAAATASRLGARSHLLLWQPVVSGRRFVQQFLRSRVMRDAIRDGAERSTTSTLMNALSAGDTIEVGGYTIAPALLLPLDQLEMSALPVGSVVHWLEVSDSDAPGPSHVANEFAGRWRNCGVDVTTNAVVGAQFWQTQEITECMPLVQSSVNLLTR